MTGLGLLGQRTGRCGQFVVHGGFVADLTREELQRLARLGAKSRLEELRREETSIRRAFPDLFAGGRGRASGRGGASPQRRPRMSGGARQAGSRRLKKDWGA